MIKMIEMSKGNRGDYVLWLAAGLALLASVYLWFTGQREEGLFVAVWVPSMFAFAAYLRLRSWRL